MRPSWLPSVGDILFLLILFLLIFRLPFFVFGDGSTGWHLVTGHYVIDHFAIPHKDLISYTFPDKAWVAYEWLFDTTIACLDKIAGLKLVALATYVAIATLFLLLYQDCRKQNCHFLTSLFLCVSGSLISAIHWLVRPHIVTFFGVYFFTKYLQKFYDNKVSISRLGFILFLTMLVWVNSHPAFLIAFVILAIYLFAELFKLVCISESPEKPDCFKRLKQLIVLSFSLVLTTLINPYGFNLYKYIFEYLQQKNILAQTEEFLSPVFHGLLQPSLLEIFFALVCLGLYIGKKKIVLPQFLLVLAFAHLALSAQRNMALFVIVSVPIIAQLLSEIDINAFWKISKNNSSDSVSIESSENNVNSKLFLTINKLWQKIGSIIDSMEFRCTRHILPIFSVIILAISCFKDGKALGINIINSDFSAKNKPTKTLKWIEANKLDMQSGFNFDNWGGYLAYRTGKRVFIDDRADFYGQNFYLEYAKVAQLQAGWQDVLSKYKISWILFPNESYLVSYLKSDNNWQLVCSDDAASLFVKNTK